MQNLLHFPLQEKDALLGTCAKRIIVITLSYIYEGASYNYKFLTEQTNLDQDMSISQYAFSLNSDNRTYNQLTMIERVKQISSYKNFNY